MILQIFTIHDSKASAYLPPFYLPQRGMALRTFADCVNDQEHAFSRHPEDYTLMMIGTWDDKTAIAITTPPESIGNGLEFTTQELDQEPPNSDQIELTLNEEPEKRFGKSNNEDTGL